MADKSREGRDAIMKNEDREGRDVNVENEEFRDEFQCCVCLDLMYKPVVLACGHISCFWCVFKAMDTSDHSHCPVCRNPYAHFPRVCESMHHLLLNLYPEIYKRRAKQVAEEEKKCGHESQQFEENLMDSLAGEVREDNSCVQPASEGALSSENDPNHLQTTSTVQVTDQKNTTKEGEDEDHTRKKLLTYLQCAVCKQLLFRPVVLNCGHIYCEGCVQNPDDSVCRCPVCQCLHPYGFPSVCLVLHHFLEDYFPEEYTLTKESSTSNQKACSSGSAVLERQENAATDESSPWWSGQARLVHRGVGCDHCGMCPIIGERYKCKDCLETIGFDLCEECFRSSSKLPGRFNQQHTPEHKFNVVPPISMQDTILTLGTVGFIREYSFRVVDDNSEEPQENPSTDPFDPHNVSVRFMRAWRSARQAAIDGTDNDDDSDDDSDGGGNDGDDGEDGDGDGDDALDENGDEYDGGDDALDENGDEYDDDQEE